MLIIFRQLLQHLGCKFPFDRSDHKAFRYSSYSLNRSDFVEISNAFQDLFPEAYKQLSSIKLFENLGYHEKSKKHHEKVKHHQKCSNGYTKKTLQNGKKEFTCRQCGIIRRISKSKILTNKVLVRKLNWIKPPTINCKTHCWKLTQDGIPSAIFSCILCGKGAILQTESEERLNLIMDLVEQDRRLKDMDEARTLCRELMNFFH